MPIFVYECKSCEHTFERLVGSSEEPNPICESCEADTKRLIAQVSINIPGSMSSATVPQITRAEEGMHREHQKVLEKNWNRVESGEIRFKTGKHRDKRFDPDIPKQIH